MDYKNKYLKYKNKYLILNGGANLDERLANNPDLAQKAIQNAIEYAKWQNTKKILNS